MIPVKGCGKLSGIKRTNVAILQENIRRKAGVFKNMESRRLDATNGLILIIRASSTTAALLSQQRRRDDGTDCFDQMEDVPNRFSKQDARGRWRDLQGEASASFRHDGF